MADTTDVDDDSAAPQPRAVELVAELHAILDELQTVNLSPCTDEELIEVAAATERAIVRTTYAGDRQVAEVEGRDLPRKTGYRTLIQFMNHRLRVTNPVRRRKHLNATATLTCLSGDRLEPEHPTLAAAFAAGTVGTAHVQAALDVLDQIPHAVDHDVKAVAERQMAEIAEATPPPPTSPNSVRDSSRTSTPTAHWPTTPTKNDAAACGSDANAPTAPPPSPAPSVLN